MQKYKTAICIALLLLALAGGWYFLAGRNDVSDIGERADAVRNELESAEAEQRDQAEALDRATVAAERSQSGIRNSQESADRIEDAERIDAEIIGKCQSIIESIRSRSEEES